MRAIRKGEKEKNPELTAEMPQEEKVSKINSKFDVLILFKTNIKATRDNENISRLCWKPYIYSLQLAEF